MSLICEDGAGVPGAQSYAALAFIDAYWAARPHSPLAATWAEASPQSQEGAAREATAYIDATWGQFYKGVRRGYVQGLLHPRSGAKDEAGYDLPGLPPELQAAVAELAPRALSAPLAADVDMGARVKSLTKKVGPLEKSTEFFDSGMNPPRTSYGIVAGILAPILNGAQPGAAGGQWNWGIA